MTRTSRKRDRPRRLGATPIVVDVYQADALTRTVVDFGTELIVNQLTDLPDDPIGSPSTARPTHAPDARAPTT